MFLMKSPSGLVGSPEVTVPLAMVIHLLNGNSRDFPIFISEADYPGVERWVFTIGLALSGIIQMVFAYRMWLQTKNVGRRKLVHFSLLCGLVTGGNFTGDVFCRHV